MAFLVYGGEGGGWFGEIQMFYDWFESNKSDELTFNQNLNDSKMEWVVMSGIYWTNSRVYK